MEFKGTTILAVKRNNEVAIAGDGQVTAGNAILKGNARKVRRLYNNKVITGFAGTTADAFTLFELFEKSLSETNGDLERAAVRMAKQWRTDRSLSKLEAMLIVANEKKILLISGTGDIVEPEHDAIAIGSGGNYALSAALAFFENEKLSAREIAEKSLHIAADICIYTNHSVIVEEMKSE